MYNSTQQDSQNTPISTLRKARIQVKDRETIMTIIQGMTIRILNIICNLVLY